MRDEVCVRVFSSYAIALFICFAEIFSSSEFPLKVAEYVQQYWRDARNIQNNSAVAEYFNKTDE